MRPYIDIVVERVLDICVPVKDSFINIPGKAKLDLGEEKKRLSGKVELAEGLEDSTSRREEKENPRGKMTQK